MIDVCDRTDRAWATGLLNQQIWCWGQDVKRPEGNWLSEIGFERTTPPEYRKECSSVYTLPIGVHSRIVLRGFGVYIGDDLKGGLFIERYGFSPKVSADSRLKCPPWSNKDLPDFANPSLKQRSNAAILLLELLDWIRQYECDVVTRLGVNYRRASLEKWNNGKRPVIPAELIASSWRKLSLMIAADVEAWLPINQDDVPPLSWFKVNENG